MSPSLAFHPLVMNKHVVSSFTLFLLLTCFTGFLRPVQAQGAFSFGPQIGANTSTSQFVGNPNVYATSYLAPAYRKGLEAGIQAEFRFGHVAIQPAVRFAQQGFQLRGIYNETVNGGAVVTTTVDQRYRLNYLTVPVNVAYAFRPNGQGWQLFAGGYASVLLGGQAQLRNSSTTFPGGNYENYSADQAVKPGSEAKNDGNEYFQHYDAGVQAGVGYRCHDFLIQAGYYLGLLNTGVSYPLNAPDYRDGPTYRNRSFQLTASYLFSKK